jgi:hypothetical protein
MAANPRLNNKTVDFGFIKGGPCLEEPDLACGFADSAAPIACGAQTVSIAITKVTVSGSRPVNRLLPPRKIGTPDMSITPLP